MREGIGYLDGPRLRRCLTAGLDRLIAEREYLNKINVFPVPDGDTGNNLARTALAARAAIAEDCSSAAEMLTQLADGALDAAQGNSGVILAQFFQGLATALAGKERIHTAELAAALAAAAVTTRTALAKPREGTLVTVIDAAAAAAQRNSGCKDFAEFLPMVLAASRAALSATTEQLEELRKAGVVDAGGHGFVCILEGCTGYLLHGSLREQPAPRLPEVESAFADHLEHEMDLEFRYCTECMVSGENLNSNAIRQELEALGNSMVIAGSDSRLRIHIHTNEPESIFELVGEFGTVDKTKADDMIGQARSLTRVDRDVAIVTDSAADIAASVMDELGIHMVPLRVQFGTDSYLDKVGMSPAEFRRELLSNPNTPGTSQPTQGDFRRMYEFLGTHFGQTVSVHLSSGLSGTHQGAVTAAGRLDQEIALQIVDSLNVSVGQGLLTVRAAQLAEQGLRGEQLAAAIAAEAGGVHTFALVPDLTNAVRSGRIKALVKLIADLLHLTPILSNTQSGKIGISGFMFGRHNLVARFAKHTLSQLGGNRSWEYAIAHGYHEASDAQQLDELLSKQMPDAECAWKTEIGTALGVHAGMAALVVAFRDTSADN
jgi:DegV family protein with EDD domain